MVNKVLQNQWVKAKHETTEIFATDRRTNLHKQQTEHQKVS